METADNNIPEKGTSVGVCCLSLKIQKCPERIYPSSVVKANLRYENCRFCFTDFFTQCNENCTSLRRPSPD